jgi:hypothetical protein
MTGSADETHAATSRAAMARMAARRRAEGRRRLAVWLPGETIARLDALVAAMGTGRAGSVSV